MQLRKITAILLSLITAILFILPTTVSADTIFDQAKNIDTNKKVSKTLKPGEYLIYKITPTEKGTAKVKLTSDAHATYFFVYDVDGNSLDYDADITSGSKSLLEDTTFYRNRDTGAFKGTLSWDVKANKTYYIKIAPNNQKTKCTASFFYPSGEPADDTFMTATLKKGDTLKLGAVAPAGKKSSDIKWSSSNKTAAAISADGLVTAVKKGEAIITVKCGNKSQKIKIIVE